MEILFQPTSRHNVTTGRVTNTMPFTTADPTKGYAWVKVGLNTYTMRARFNANGRLTATAPDGTPWAGAGWTFA